MKNTRLDSHWDWIRAMALIWVGLGLLLLPSHPHAQSLGSIDAIDDTATTPAGAPVTIPVLANDLGVGLSILQVSTPAQGTAVISGNAVLYQPKAGFAGVDVFVYTLSDGVSIDSATVIVTIEPPPPPIAVDDIATTRADVPISLNVLANDTGSGIQVTSVTNPQGGAVSTSASGIVTYTPAPNFSGPDTFAYTLTDAFNRTATATVTVTVTPTLIAANDTAATTAGVATTINVLANDTQGVNIRLASIQNPTTQGGSATISSDSILYRPAPDFAGTDTFTYSITDGISLANATVTVTVRRELKAADDTAATTAGVATTINVLANDTQGVNIRLASVQNPTAQGGSATISSASILYRPAPGFAGTDVFTYSITDGVSLANATITIAVNPPQLNATNDAATTAAGTATTLFVLANDNGVGLSVTQISPPLHGSIIISDNAITYRPEPGFAGVDVFTYTITDTFNRTTTATVTVTVNPTPLNAVNDAAATATDTAVVIDLLSNDSGTGLTILQIGKPSHGVVTANSNTITYRPEPGFTGTDTFTYTITDALNNTTTATVTILVNPPVLNAVNDTASTTAGVATTIDVLSNDIGSGLTVTQVSPPPRGSATLSSNIISYRPANDFVGTDTFTYTITDAFNRTATATITITVNPPQLGAVNDAVTTTAGTATTINVLANDTGTGLSVTQVSAASHGSTALNGNIITYRPEPGFAGTDSFTYTITDAFNRTTTAVVTITIAAPKQTLTAANDTAVAASGTAVTIDVLANDTGVGLTVTQVSDPAHGVVTLSGNTITYRPDPGFTGTDAFTYTVSDGVNTATSSVTVTVQRNPEQIAELLEDLTDNPNAKSIGGAIVNLCSDPDVNSGFQRDCTALINAAKNNDPGVGLALEQITPQSLSTALDISQSSAQSHQLSVNARLFSLRSGVGIKGINLDRLRLNIQRGGWTLSGQDLRYLLASVDGGGTPSAEVDNDWGAFGVFASGSINLGSKDETENQAGFDFKSRELTLGADYRFSEQFALGAALSHTAVNNTIDSNGGAVDSKGNSLSLYGIYHPTDSFYLNGIINYGWNDYDQQRNLSYQLETAQVSQQFDSSYGGQQFSVDVGAGYQFGYGDLRFGPEARLNYLTIKVDSFAEQARDSNAGSAWAVALDEQNMQSLTLSLSAQISYLLEQSWGILQPRMALSWLHELKNNTPHVLGRFVQGADAPENYFELLADPLDQNYFRLDLGLGARFNQGPNAVLQYRMLMGYDNLTEQSIMAELRWDF